MCIRDSFITGTEPANHGITVGNRYKNPLLNWVQVNLWRPLGLTGKTGIGNLLRKWFRYDTCTKEDIEVPTIFDLIDNSVAINIPSFNESESNKRLRELCAGYLDGTVDRDKLEFFLEANYNETMSSFFDAISRDPPLVMVHIFPLDIVGHSFYDDEETIERWYRRVDADVGKIKKMYPKRWCLIVSDHGLLNGKHTNYAFYSSNIPIGLKEPRLTDFKKIILKVIKNAK